MALKENIRNLSADTSIIRKSFYENSEKPFNTSTSVVKNSKVDAEILSKQALNTISASLVNIDEIRKSPAYGNKIFPDSSYEGELSNGTRPGKGLIRADAVMKEIG